MHKSQGLTLRDGCVFNVDHEPTWSPLKCLGLAFVGMSRATDFARMAFKYVPDYWAFRAVADTDLFRWRAELEKRPRRAARCHSQRHLRRRCVRRRRPRPPRGMVGGPAASSHDAAEVEDLRQMLSLRGMLSAPHYDDRPTKLPASKLGGGRKRRKTCGQCPRPSTRQTRKKAARPTRMKKTSCKSTGLCPC